MKNILILILIISSFKLIAQHPELPMVKWYAQTITINGTSTSIPNNPLDFPTSTIRFFSSGFVSSKNFEIDAFSTDNCKIGFTGNVDYISNNIFTFNEFNLIQDNLVDCSNDLQNFMNLCISFYNDEVTEQFSYTITTETDGSKTLIITNDNGSTINYTTDTYFLNTAPNILTNNTWFLHKMIIDGVDNTPPNNAELPEITLSLNGGISAIACSIFVGYSNFYDYTLSQFYFYDISTDYGLTLCNPDYPENNAYTDLYIRDFYLQNLPGPFNYEHTINGNEETLTITNPLGNQAIYGNHTLSNQKIITSKFYFYPNPVYNNLTIKEDTNNLAQISDISIYNSLGSEIIKTVNKSINTSNLANGIYLIKINLKNNTYFFKKFIKK